MELYIKEIDGKKKYSSYFKKNIDETHKSQIEDEEDFDNIWNLEVGKKYLLRAVLFDYHHHQITTPNNLKFKVILYQIFIIVFLV